MTDDPTTNPTTQSFPGMNPARPIESAGTASEAPEVELLDDRDDAEEAAMDGEGDMESGDDAEGMESADGEQGVDSGSADKRAESESLDGGEDELTSASQSGAGAEPVGANPTEANPRRDRGNP